MGELKPCPFCGDSGVRVFGDRPGEAMLGGFNVCCENPNCQATCRHSGNREKAIAAWNRRATTTLEGEQNG